MEFTMEQEIRLSDFVSSTARPKRKIKKTAASDYLYSYDIDLRHHNSYNVKKTHGEAQKAQTSIETDKTDHSRDNADYHIIDNMDTESDHSDHHTHGDQPRDKTDYPLDNTDYHIIDHVGYQAHVEQPRDEKDHHPIAKQPRNHKTKTSNPNKNKKVRREPLPEVKVKEERKRCKNAKFSDYVMGDDREERGLLTIEGLPLGGRKSKSLIIMTTRFLNMGLKKGNAFRLDHVANEIGMGGKQRRIYDIANTFESMEIVKRVKSNTFVWQGTEFFLPVLHSLYKAAKESNILQVMSELKSKWEYGNSISDVDLNKTLISLGRFRFNMKDKFSVGDLTLNFLKVILLSGYNKPVSLTVMAALLLEEAASKCSPSQGRIRRLYDVASILVAMGVIRKDRMELNMGKKVPCYCLIVDLSNFEIFNPLPCVPVKLPDNLCDESSSDVESTKYQKKSKLKRRNVPKKEEVHYDPPSFHSELILPEDIKLEVMSDQEENDVEDMLGNMSHVYEDEKNQPHQDCPVRVNKVIDPLVVSAEEMKKIYMHLIDLQEISSQNLTASQELMTDSTDSDVASDMLDNQDGINYSNRPSLQDKSLKDGCDKQFTCACGRQFHLKGVLISHMYIKHSDGTRCNLCRKVFQRKGHLCSHMVIHSQDNTRKKISKRRFPCDVCGKQFKRRNHRDDHLFTHLEEKLYNCNVCSKTYKQIRYLKSHMRLRHHGYNSCDDI